MNVFMSPPNHELLPIAMCAVPCVFSSIMVDPITCAFLFVPMPSSPIFHMFSGFFAFLCAHLSVCSSSLASYELFMDVILPFVIPSSIGSFIIFVLSLSLRLPSRITVPSTPLGVGAMYASLPGKLPPVPGSEYKPDAVIACLFSTLKVTSVPFLVVMFISLASVIVCASFCVFWCASS